MPETLDIMATTAFGLEAVVVRELAALGYEAKAISTGRVWWRGDASAVCRANLWLRAADRVLIRVGQFPAADFEQLFEGVKALPWERWIARDFAFPVNGRSVKSQLSSVPAVQRATKKAIVERLMHAHRVSMLPETGPMVTVEVGLLDNLATLTIDTSGAGLHKRGYRPTVGDAALKETMAAGLVMLSGWRPQWPLVDPFCGTGTIPIEAAMIARDMAPGLRRGFDAELWPAIPANVWTEERAAAEAKARPRLPVTIHASDIDDRALGLARQHAKHAGVERDIHFHKRDFLELASKAEYGVIITNPPYGVRLGDDAAVEALYRKMPGVLRRLPTWSFHILTARLDLEQIFGQPATRRRKLFNAQIECTYFTYFGPKPPRERQPDPANADQLQSIALEQSDADEVPQPDQPPDLAHDAPDAAAGEVNIPTTATQPAAQPAAQPATQAAGRSPRDTTDAAETTATTIRSDAGSAERFAGGERVSTSERAATPDRSLRVPTAPSGGVVFGGLRERDLREAAEFRACLSKNVRHLRRYPARGITCYRVYERDCPDVPLIVDRYEDRVHVAEYERMHSRTPAQQADWFDEMREVIAEVCGVAVEAVFMKEKHRQRDMGQHEKVANEKNRFIVQEGGLRFEVNLSDYIDTGLFLDHRLTRAMFREMAAGKRVLNLFCYTGAFTVYAAAGGAEATTSVDLSNTYLAWAERNLGLNRLMSSRHALVRSDVLEFLAGHRPAAKYDLAIVDPPTFSRSKATEEDWEVAVDQVALFRTLTPLMSPGGTVLFSTNFRRFKLAEEELVALGLTVREISHQTVPPEYRNRRIHRCWRLVVPGGAAAERLDRRGEDREAGADRPS